MGGHPPLHRTSNTSAPPPTAGSAATRPPNKRLKHNPYKFKPPRADKAKPKAAHSNPGESSDGLSPKANKAKPDAVHPNPSEGPDGLSPKANKAKPDAAPSTGEGPEGFLSSPSSSSSSSHLLPESFHPPLSSVLLSPPSPEPDEGAKPPAPNGESDTHVQSPKGAKSTKPPGPLPPILSFETERECNYCRRKCSPVEYAVVLKSGKCRCRICVSSVYREAKALKDCDASEVARVRAIPMRDRMEWHRDHATLPLKDLMHNMHEWLTEHHTVENIIARTGGGGWLDKQDLEEKYKRKPDQLANLLRNARREEHPIRKCILYEDIDFKTNTVDSEKMTSERGREATGGVSIQKSKAKPLEGVKKQAKPLTDQQAKPPKHLSESQIKEIEKLCRTMDVQIGFAVRQIHAGCSIGVATNLTKKLQSIADDCLKQKRIDWRLSLGQTYARRYDILANHEKR